MKAVILAAGKGVRLLPLTRDRPKPLLEVCGRPFMDYLIENLQESGISDFCFVIGYRKEKMIEYFVKRNVKCDIVFQKEQKGTGHAVGLAEDFVGGENFILAMGDNLYSVEDLRKVQKDDGYSYVVGKEVERPELYGVLSEGSGFLKEIKEKPKEPAGNLVNTGLYKLTPEIFRALEGTGTRYRFFG